MDLLQHFAALTLSWLVLTTAPHPQSISSSAISSAAEPFASTTAPAELLGLSGNLRALFGVPDSQTISPALRALIGGLPNATPGVYPLGMVAPDGEAIVMLSLATFVRDRAVQLGGYRTGLWPGRGRLARDPRYAPPTSFIAVNAADQFTMVSKRFRLGDFLTHDQAAVWPKVLVLRPRLVDKLELIGAELDRRGLPDRLHVMSGFRSPQYNRRGVGEKGGRAAHSRHMYGDAADVFVDGDGNGRMDDLNRDGRIDVRDARVLFAVAEQVEAQHPELVGGLSAYAANGAHGPFMHVDTRGFRARW